MINNEEVESSEITKEDVAKIMAIVSVFTMNKFTQGKLEKATGMTISQVLEEGYNSALSSIEKHNFISKTVEDFEKVMKGEMNIDDVMEVD